MTEVTRKCYHCSKALIYIISILFWMLGAALLGLGVWLHLTNDTVLAVSPGYRLLMPAALFITPGCLSIIVGFLGCCGAIMENKCMIISYCVLMLIVLVLELTGSVVALTGDLHLAAHKEVRQQLELSLTERYPISPREKHELDMVNGWDKLQQQFNCCGVDNYQDWFRSHAWPTQDKVPDSCCKNQYVGCGEVIDVDNIYNMGCGASTKEFMARHLRTVAIVTLVFVALQVVTIAGAAIFMRYHRKHKELR